jgi:hypothetical protein
MTWRRLVGRFLADLYADWLTLMSGIVSVCFAALAAVIQYEFGPWVFWPMAYLCLLAAAFLVWRREAIRAQEAEAKLVPSDATAARRAEAARQLEQLSNAERQALRQVMFCGMMNDVQMTDFLRRNGLALFPPADLERKTTFMGRDFAGNWSINPAFQEALQSLLG